MAMYVIVVDHSRRGTVPVEPDSYKVYGQPGDGPFASFYDAWQHADAFVARPWQIARLDFSEMPDEPDE